jgi:hypothetical protein
MEEVGKTHQIEPQSRPLTIDEAEVSSDKRTDPRLLAAPHVRPLDVDKVLERSIPSTSGT